MASKILFNNRDVGDHYEPSDSENEYTEREQKLLQKVRKGRPRNEEPQEIMAFDQNDEESDEEGLYSIVHIVSERLIIFKFSLQNMMMISMKNSKPIAISRMEMMMMEFRIHEPVGVNVISIEQISLIQITAVIRHANKNKPKKKRLKHLPFNNV